MRTLLDFGKERASVYQREAPGIAMRFGGGRRCDAKEGVVEMG